MFTTRLPELATTVNAIQIPVDELDPEQALELLGRWTDLTPTALPESARALCTRVGNLALGVAMAGAMVARGRSFTDVLTLIEQDLNRVRADLDPEYPYRTLFAAIEAGITDLPEDGQGLYAQLAVFAERGPFTRAAAQALWQAELPDADVGDLLAELTGRSLFTAVGDGWYAAHDLQYDVLVRQARQWRAHCGARSAAGGLPHPLPGWVGWIGRLTHIWRVLWLAISTMQAVTMDFELCSPILRGFRPVSLMVS